jgi:hypothetical protein
VLDVLFKASDLPWPETAAQKYARIVTKLYGGKGVPTAAVAGRGGVSTKSALEGIRQAVRLGLLQRVGGHCGGGWIPKKGGEDDRSLNAPGEIGLPICHAEVDIDSRHRAPEKAAAGEQPPRAQRT